MFAGIVGLGRIGVTEATRATSVPSGGDATCQPEDTDHEPGSR